MLMKKGYPTETIEPEIIVGGPRDWFNCYCCSIDLYSVSNDIIIITRLQIFYHENATRFWSKNLTLSSLSVT